MARRSLTAPPAGGAADARAVVSWQEVAALSYELAGRLRGRRFDGLLGIARGGLVPAALVAQELGLRNVMVAAASSYQGSHRGDSLAFLQFPPADALAGRHILIVDDIWDSGRTMVACRERVHRAGGGATTAVLHYKPLRSDYPELAPDHWCRETDAWIVYPWERDT
jgi:hypothetical protein